MLEEDLKRNIAIDLLFNGYIFKMTHCEPVEITLSSRHMNLFHLRILSVFKALELQ